MGHVFMLLSRSLLFLLDLTVLNMTAFAILELPIHIFEDSINWFDDVTW